MSNANSYKSNNNEAGVTYTKKDPNRSPFYTSVFPSLTEKAHQYVEDFDTYNAGNWVVTETQAGATQALTDEDGGVLLLTNSAADNDLNALQKVGESFTFTAGKRLIFDSRFKVSDATQSDVIMGLQITDTTPLAVSDGVYFIKNDDAATIDFVVVKNSTATTVTSIATLVTATYIRLGFYYNGIDTIEYYVDGIKKGTLSTLTNLPTTELTISFGIQNGAAAAKTMSIDYVEVIKDR